MVRRIDEVGIILAEPVVRPIHENGFGPGFLKGLGRGQAEVADGAGDDDDFIGKLIGWCGHDGLLRGADAFPLV